jgi:hypothetical protein
MAVLINYMVGFVSIKGKIYMASIAERQQARRKPAQSQVTDTSANIGRRNVIYLTQPVALHAMFDAAHHCSVPRRGPFPWPAV